MKNPRPTRYTPPTQPSQLWIRIRLTLPFVGRGSESLSMSRDTAKILTQYTNGKNFFKSTAYHTDFHCSKDYLYENSLEMFCTKCQQLL